MELPLFCCCASQRTCEQQLGSSERGSPFSCVDMKQEALLLKQKVDQTALEAIAARNEKLDVLAKQAQLLDAVKGVVGSNPELWSMVMADGSKMVPDLEWFHANYAPDEDRADDIERAEHLRMLADVYGEENILTDEQVAERQAEHRLRWQARTRERAWREVPQLRRKWVELNRVYGPGSDFGAF